MEGYFYSTNKDLFSVSFVNETNEREDRHNWSHYPILHRVLNFMEDRGFEVGRDSRIEKYYKCLNKDHWYGKKGNLEFKAERYTRGFRIEFFQNINFENKSGGEYDFYKFDKAPYLIKLMWINETYKIGKFIEKIVPGVAEDSKKIYKSAEDKIKNHFVESWHHNQNDMSFNLSDLDGITCEDTCNNKDRDGKTIYNGEVKYFRDYKGRLNRGKVYHNINNMWWVILNDTDYTNEACFALFDATEEDFKNRRIQKSRKESYETSRVAARKNFNNKFTYKDITRKDIEKLHELVGVEIEKAAQKSEAIETMKINPKIRTRCTSNKKIKHAFLYVDAHYFTKRECISFNADRFIGFAGWASDTNVRPILKGFNKWCSYLSKNK